MKSPNSTQTPEFRQAFLFWLKLGFISFGGPAGQIAIMHEELVERRKWIGEKRFIEALDFCILLPGPEATQLAIYIGWLLNGFKGGLLAGIFFILPSIVLLWALSVAYVTFGNIPSISAVFFGLKAAVVAIVIHAVIKMSRRAWHGRVDVVFSILSFLTLYLTTVTFPIVILAAAFIGFVVSKSDIKAFAIRQNQNENNDDPQLKLKPSRFHPIVQTLLFFLLWWTPVLLARFWFGAKSVAFDLGLFFSKTAMVTFGGAYAVLPYVQQNAVYQYHWLSSSQMVDGLGLAETTPGPLIMVLQFVGFLAGWNHPEHGLPLVSATIGALLTTWVTFVPCFIWIFVGAPFFERFKNRRSLQVILRSITAAVVGVMSVLAINIAHQVFFEINGTINPLAVVLSAATLLVLWKWGIDLIAVVIGAGLLGLAAHVLKII